MCWLIYAIFIGTGVLGVVTGNAPRRWPPASPDMIKDPVTGVYDIQIKPHVTAASFTGSAICSYANYYEKKYHKKDGKGNCFLRAVSAIPKNHWAAYDMYPEPVGHFRILKEVRAGTAVYQAPMNDPPRFILHAPKTCDKNHDIVIMIESCATCAARRKQMRQTFLKRKLWSNVNIGWVFTTGLPAKQPSKTFNFPGMKITRQAYKVGTDIKHIVSKLITEAKKYGDILVGDFEEDTYHHVWTYIVSIRWASVFCNKKVPIFAYMQSYYSLVPGKFVQWLQKLSSKAKPRYYGGYVHRNAKVNHDVKNPWGMAWEELPWEKYVPLVDRMLAILGHDTVQEAAILSAFTRYSKILSFYIAVVNRKLRIHPKHVHGIISHIRNKKHAKRVIAAIHSEVDKYINWNTGKVM